VWTGRGLRTFQRYFLSCIIRLMIEAVKVMIKAMIALMTEAAPILERGVRPGPAHCIRMYETPCSQRQTKRTKSKTITLGMLKYSLLISL
jgi:hypothetical protein